MGDYNGFTEEERAKGGAIQTWAYGKGYLVRAERCEACNVKGQEPADIVAHLEDYTEPITGSIFLCYRCHKMLHLRFRFPEAWSQYRDKVREGSYWPLATNNPRVVMRDHVTPKLDGMSPEGERGESKNRTVLDDIDDGVLHPGPRERWTDKMQSIMDNKRVYEIPTDQMSFLW